MVTDSRMGKVYSIELLRWFAAVLVLLAHVKFPVLDVCGADAVSPALEFYFGACGVDLFFVISGFVIALTIDRPTTTWQSFLSSRLARVAPPYAIVSIACLLTVRVRVFEITPQSVFNSFLYLPVTESSRFAGTLHPFGWTLSFEMCFYLLATAAIVAIGRRGAIRILILGLTTGPFVLVVSDYANSWYFPRFILSPLAVEFALGCLAYHICQLRIPVPVGVLLLVVGAVAALLSFDHSVRLCWATELLADGTVAIERLLRWGGAAFLVVTGAVIVESQLPRFPWLRIAERVGSLSYPLYLIQPFALLAAQGVCIGFGWINPWIVAGVAVVVPILSTVLFHRMVESPLLVVSRPLLDRLLGVRRVPRASAELHLRLAVTNGELVDTKARTVQADLST